MSWWLAIKGYYMTTDRLSDNSLSIYVFLDVTSSWWNLSTGYETFQDSHNLSWNLSWLPCPDHVAASNTTESFHPAFLCGRLLQRPENAINDEDQDRHHVARA